MQEEDIEKAIFEFQQELERGKDIARQHEINLSRFKKEISKSLSYKNNEDEWTYDYESYLMSLARIGYESPAEWGEDYYHRNWRKP